MSILFIILFYWAIGHFIFEGIIAPNLRSQTRNNLFALRDRLRRIGFRESHSDRAIITKLEAYLNFILSRGNELSITKVALFLQASGKTKQNPLSDIKDEELSLIASELADLVIKTLLINNVVLLVFMIPLLLATHLFLKSKEYLSAKKLQLLSMSQKDLGSATI